MKSEGATYAAAGVDIDLKSEFIRRLVSELKYRRKGGRKPVGVGHFTSTIPFGNSILTLGTDGVGSKLLIARQLGKWDTVGIDCVAMNVNDTICIGAEPVALVDYLALPHPDTTIAGAIGRGLNRGAALANAEIVGGEVAVLPELVSEVDLSASCLGIAAKDSLITGQAIRPGDDIVGLSSSGIHSNGYTLVRKILQETGTGLDERFGSGSLGRELLRPTTIYVRPVLRAAARHRITGMANITGGGFRNILRLKNGVRFAIDSIVRTPRIFEYVSRLGNVSSGEMFQTFNMGVGFVIICRKGEGDAVCRTVAAEGQKASVIGHVEKGSGVAIAEYGLEYSTY